jgi:hypothetical protein
MSTLLLRFWFKVQSLWLVWQCATPVCEQWQESAGVGDVDAQELIRVIETFHRLCIVVEEMGEC